MTPVRNWTPWLLLAPVLGVFVVFFAIPTMILLLTSFERLELVTYKVVENLTLHQYKRFLTDEYYLGVLATTLKISFLATVLCLLVGYPVAFYLTRASARERSMLMLLILSPILVSVVIFSFGWIIIVSPMGMVNWVLRELGVGDGRIQLRYTETTVIIGLAHAYYPFMVLAIYNSMRNIDPAIVRAARSLGASELRAILRVVVPLSVPGILSGSFIVFALSVSSFVTPTLLGGVWVKMMAFLAWQQTTHLLDWPFGAAITVILLLTTGVLMLGYSRLMERWWFAGVFRGH